MKKFFKEFKEFINRGNIVDLAVAFIISTTFTAIVNALVNNVIMPLISAIFGKVDVSDLYFTINHSVIPYGLFIQAVINFLMIAFILFLVVRTINKTKDAAEKEKTKHVTREEKEEIAKLGTVNMKNKKEVYAAAVELRAKKKAEAEEKARIEEENKVTTEKLLIQIRDLLSEKEGEQEVSEKPKKPEKAKKTK